MVLVSKTVQIGKWRLGCQGLKHTCGQLFASSSGQERCTYSRPVHVLKER